MHATTGKKNGGHPTTLDGTGFSISTDPELLRETERQGDVFPSTTDADAPSNERWQKFDPGAFSREERMRLVQKLFILPGQNSPRMVLFCDVEAGNGSSTICALVAESLAAQVKAAVCLVDANLRAPYLHQRFRVKGHRGLTDAVLDSGSVRKFAQHLNGSGLWVMNHGVAEVDPHTLLNSDQFQSRIAELRAEFDYVLLDGPPVNLYVDSTLLGKMAEGVVLVLEANATRREAARKARQSLESAGVRVYGAVLNKRTFPVPALIYRSL